MNCLILGWTKKISQLSRDKLHPLIFYTDINTRNIHIQKQKKKIKKKIKKT
jgi:hypothetical protein